MVLSLQNLHTNKHYLQDTLYVVLDTNVLLSHLKLISELKDFPIEGKLAGCMESPVTLSCKIYCTSILEFFKMAINLWGKCDYRDSHLPTSTSSGCTLVPLFKLPYACYRNRKWWIIIVVGSSISYCLCMHVIISISPLICMVPLQVLPGLSLSSHGL